MSGEDNDNGKLTSLALKGKAIKNLTKPHQHCHGQRGGKKHHHNVAKIVEALQADNHLFAGRHKKQ
jgi:hypothetical protein